MGGRKPRNFNASSKRVRRRLDPIDQGDPRALVDDSQVDEIHAVATLQDKGEKKQFPPKSSEITESGSVEDTVKEGQKCRDTFPSVLFAAALLEPLKAGTGLGSGAFKSVKTEDAIQCLLKAPMLSDIQEWSHWDHLFAPSLGPIVKWLESEVHTNELFCLVTRNGKVIRIDPTATVDKLLNASFHRSPIKAATQLLSLLALNAGKMRFIMDYLKSRTCGPIAQYCRSFVRPGVKNWRFAHNKGSIRLKPIMVEHPGNAAHVKVKKLSKKIVSAVSVFILKILGYMPTEFCSFAADILLSGLENFIEDAPSALLCECNMEQRLMLHEVGLSLGISKWGKNFHEFPSISATKVSVPSLVSRLVYGHDEAFSDHDQLNLGEVSGRKFEHNLNQCSPEFDEDQDTTPVRQDKFVMDPCHIQTEISMSEECHTLLGRFIDFLSQLFPRGPYCLLVPVLEVLLGCASDFKSGFLVSDDVKCLKECLLKLETELLPLKHKWVPQHPYIVCVYSHEDEELLKHFNQSDGMKAIDFSYLVNGKKKVLQQKIAVITETIGISTLSKVVTRAAISPSIISCSRTAFLVGRALERARQYISRSNFEDRNFILQRLSYLQVFEVEKLAYRFVATDFKIFSKEQFECGCLQEGNVLYITPNSDSHSMSMELSRELMNGNPNQRLASLFNLYITMEMLNGQNESEMYNGSSFHENVGSSLTVNEKIGIENYQSPPGKSSLHHLTKIVEISNNSGQNTIPCGEHGEALISNKLCFGRANFGKHDEARKVGLEGERSAFDHLKEMFGVRNVEWLNSEVESMSPYDFIIWEDESKKVVKMYVGVKATKYAAKNSFFISHTQWKFACEMGKKFGIMHICLTNGKVSFLENPVEKSRQGLLQHCLQMTR